MSREITTTMISRPVEVNLIDLTKSDLKLIDRDQLLVITLGLIELLKGQSHTKAREEEEIVLKTAATIDKMSPEPPIDMRSGHSKNIGVKIGVSSKYHYISFNHRMRKAPWCASVKIKGKNNTKYFKTEMEAALAIDNQLEFLQDDQRPKNRNEHPEVMEAYIRAQEKK